MSARAMGFIYNIYVKPVEDLIALQRKSHRGFCFRQKILMKVAAEG
jgi:hypothetical protein